MNTRIPFLITLQALFFALVSVAFAAPATLTQSVSYQGETITLQLKIEDLRGANFELFTQNASGGYDVVTPVAERSYLGTVAEYPGAVSCGILQDDGQFRGAVYFDRGVTWFTLGTSVVETRALDYGNFTNFQIPTTSSVTPGQAGSDTYSFEMGIDADYNYYNTTSGGSVAKAFETIEYSISVTRAIYMRDALLRPYLGRVIIRTDLANDPYTGLTQGGYLDAVRTEWNNNQTTTDPALVAGVSPTKIGGGLAWVGVVGTSSGYSVNQSGSTGAFDVVLRHEIGHNWNLPHFTGGSPEGAGLMGGNVPGRMSSTEAHRVMGHRDSRISMGGILSNEGIYTNVELPPFASLDSIFFTQTLDTSVAIDPTANDFDANNQSISLVSFESTSAKGGSISQQGSTLNYTAPGNLVGTDYFLYTIADSAGKTATGVVVVDVRVDEDLELYLPLDEVAGTSSANQAIYGNDGTLSGTDFGTVNAPGVYGNAPVLDGVDDHLTVSGLSVSTNSTTLTAWIKPNASNNPWAGIIFSRSGSACGLNLGSDGTDLRYHWNNNHWSWSSGLSPAADVWTFVALVIEPTQATIYMNDGTGFVSATRAASHSPASMATTYIGRDPNSAARSFAGGVDEARIYGKALTQSELQAILEGGAAESPSPFNGATAVNQPEVSWGAAGGATSYNVYFGTSETAVANANTSSPEFVGSVTEPQAVVNAQANSTYFWRVDAVKSGSTVSGPVWNFSTGSVVYEFGLVGHWKFDEGSGTQINDLSANGNQGVLNGTATRTAGFEGDAIDFGGVDGSITFGNGPSLGGKTDFTTSAWIKTSASSDQVIIQQRNGGYNGQYQFKVQSNGALNFFVYGNNAYQFNITTSQTVNDGAWHYVSAVRDGDNAYIYIDGNPAAAASGNGAARDLSSSIGVGIGRDIRDNNRPFNGQIDEVKLYSLAKSGAQLQQSYNDYLSNSNSAPVVSASTFTLAENQNAGASVGQVSASDPDAGDVLSYSIVSGNASGLFAINSTTGAITSTGAADFESVSSYALTVEVSDNATSPLVASATITVNISNVNEAPTASNASGSLAENTSIGTVVTTVTASDVDANEALSYAITSGNDGSFAIDPNTGVISTSSNLNFEGTSSYALEVTVTDNGGLTATSSVSISVTNVNEVPSASGGSASIAENSSIGSSVVGIVASDPDAGDSLSYAITGGNDGTFVINSGSGEISLAAAVDFETNSAYALTVTATDNGGLSDSAAVNITVLDVNEAPVISGASASLAENATVGTSVASLIANDPDTGDTLSYSISGGNDGSFAIDSNTGEVSLAARLDYEVTNSYSLAITATDSSGLTDTATLIVSVTDIAELATAAWSFEEGVGSVTADSSGNGYNGTLSSPTWENGRVGNGLRFTSDEINVGNIPLGDRITIAAWIKPDALPLNHAIVSKTNSFSLKTHGDGLRFTTPGIKDHDVVNIGLLSGEWQHVAITFKQGDANGARFFLNGQLVGVVSASALANNSNPVVIGTSQWLGQEFVGVMDEVVIYDDLLSDAQVTSLFASYPSENSAPTFANGTINRANATSEQAYTGTIAGEATDADAGDTLTYSLQSGPGWLAVAADGTLSGTPSSSNIGANAFTVRATDTAGAFAEAILNIAVSADLPSVNTGVAEAITSDSATLNYELTSTGGEEPSVTLYYGTVDGGANSAAWANSLNLGSLPTGNYQTVVSGLESGSSYYFTVAATNSAGTEWGGSASFTTENDNSPKLARLTVSSVTSGTWNQVSLGQTYNSPVIIATPIYAGSSTPPVNTRIRNAAGGGFEITVERRDGQTTPVSVDVSVIVVEEGVYTLAEHGVNLEAVKFTSTITAGRNNWVTEARSYQNSYTSPVVLGQVMTSNDPSASVFWATGGSRTSIPSATALNLGKHVGEDTNTTRADETIGYIVIEAGNHTFNGSQLTAGVSQDNIRGMNSSGYSIPLSPFLTSASNAVLSSAAMDGGDGGWPILFGSNSISTSNLQVAIDEDTIGDTERNHTTEQVAYLVVE